MLDHRHVDHAVGPQQLLDDLEPLREAGQPGRHEAQPPGVEDLGAGGAGRGQDARAGEAAARVVAGDVGHDDAPGARGQAQAHQLGDDGRVGVRRLLGDAVPPDVGLDEHVLARVDEALDSADRGDRATNVGGGVGTAGRRRGPLAAWRHAPVGDGGRRRRHRAAVVERDDAGAHRGGSDRGGGEADQRLTPSDRRPRRLAHGLAFCHAAATANKALPAPGPAESAVSLR